MFCESTESDGHRVEHGPGPDNVFSSAGVKTTFCELLLGAATFPTSVGRRAHSLIRLVEIFFWVASLTGAGEQGDFYVMLLFHRLFNGDRKQES